MIDLDDVFVLYPVLDRQVAALRGLSLRVAAGERVVVNGPSGSGKSTLVRLVTGRVRPSAGSAIVLDHDLANASSKAILALQRSGIGVITQQMSNNLAVELSALHNVALQSRLGGRSKAEADRLATDMLERLGVGHVARRALSTISAGEAQRVALAAALAHRPSVIVADEPTGALDAANAAIVFDLLVELSEELHAALLVVSHDPGSRRIGHRVLEIRDGRLGAEQIEGTAQSRLVVDNRGWVRLPESDRLRAGIVDRAIVSYPTTEPANGEETSLSLRSPDPLATEPEQTHGNEVSNEVCTEASTESGAEVVSVEDASRSIEAMQILAPTTVSIRSGELSIISGRSGSGKTTLLGLIGRFAEPSTGSVRHADGVHVAVGTSTPGFAETLTVRQNIELACTVRGVSVDSARGEMIDRYLAAVSMTELAARPVSTLSGGERQRVAIVRAIASDAELVLLDEPTSQLDQGLARRIALFLLSYARSGHAVVCASHEPELIAAADRVHSLG